MHFRFINKLFLWTFLLHWDMYAIEAEETDALSGFQNLTKDYNKYLRPNFSEQPVEIAVTLEIASIASISEDNMDYTSTIFLRQRWLDERLVFEGNTSITLDPRLVQLLWVPDTYIVDSKKSFLHDVTVDNRLVRLYSNGTVLYALRITTTVACNMDLTKYPMDRQTCKLQLESWGYNDKDLVYKWMRGNDSVRGMDNLQLAQYTVEKYYINITTGMDETGVTTVLSMTTILMGSRSTLPTANCIKAIDVYLGICFAFIFGALLEYAVTHYCSEKHAARKEREKKIPPEEWQDNAVILVNNECKEMTKEDKIENLKSEIGTNHFRVNLGFWLKIREQLNMSISFFTVGNPENIDHYSRVAFPLLFLIVNLFYWLYYLYF
ncbi:gamma-aminobutyric acid receptor subunit pi-like isoform X3 [Eleutherodactylus coqui]|uniref:gamma-aminobutyric acid receptor subunit pi-like isoform X3 n=1 Tax=Eleutherodactylus coqui TaxID=57060 RepID=UPI0034636D5F